MLMMPGLSSPIEHPAQETAQLMQLMLVLSGPIEHPAQETAQLMLVMLVLSGPLEQAAQEADAAVARVEGPARVSCAMKVCS